MSDNLIITLRELEHRLMDPAVRRDRAQLEGLLCEDFVEFGSSGRVFDRETLIAELMNEAPLPPRSIDDLRIMAQTAEQALITYRSSGPAADGSGAEVVSRRSSLWIRQAGTWRLRFHQGTRCPAAAAKCG